MLFIPTRKVFTAGSDGNHLVPILNYPVPLSLSSGANKLIGAMNPKPKVEHTPLQSLGELKPASVSAKVYGGALLNPINFNKGGKTTKVVATENNPVPNAPSDNIKFVF